MPEWLHNRVVLEALEGELLGDGSLLVGRRYTNAKFQLQAKSRDQVLLAHSSMHVLGGEPVPFTRKSSGYRTTPVQMWQWASHRSQCLTEQWQRWYPQGQKIVPPDFVLTARSALHWYIGDGSLHKGQAQITLCTDSFDELSIHRLRVQLQERNLLPSVLITKKGHLRLVLSGSCVDKFLELVGPCPVPGMEYKWAVVPRKYSTKRVSVAERETMRGLRQYGYSYSWISTVTGRNISTVHEAVNGRKRRA